MAQVEVAGPRPNRASGRMVQTQRNSDGTRIIELAQHKEPKVIWITSVGPRAQWGTQETLWPVAKAALGANPSSRVTELAQPKRNFQRGEHCPRPEFMYSCGRSSVIWEVSPLAREGTATERLTQLAGAKQPPREYKDDRPHWVFSCGRSSPIWQVDRAARAADERPRTLQLAGPKRVHSEFIGNRDVHTLIPSTALKAKPTERLETLSTPKRRPDGPFREPQWSVTDTAKKASPSGRCSELAKPKSVADGYIPAREVVWSVSRSALRTGITPRVEELSQPIIRASMDHVQFDPDAFFVKNTALKGRCSRRVEELAQPLAR